MTNTTEYKPLERKFIELLRCEGSKDPLLLVQLRIKKIGFGKPCCRCGGSGIWYTNKGTCFRCGGAGYDNVRLTNANYEMIKKAVDAGKLDDYLDDLKRKEALKKADKELFSLANDNELSRDYSAFYNADRFGEGLQPIYKLRHEQTKLYDEYKRAATKFKSREFKKKWKDKQGDDFDEREHESMVSEVLYEEYKDTKDKLIKLNTEYEAFKKLFLTLFK